MIELLDFDSVHKLQLKLFKYEKYENSFSQSSHQQNTALLIPSFCSHHKIVQPSLIVSNNSQLCEAFYPQSNLIKGI